MEKSTGIYHSFPAAVTSADYDSKTKKPGPWTFFPEYTPVSGYSTWAPERTSTPWTTKVKQTSFLESEDRTSISTSALISSNTLSPASTASAHDGSQTQRPGQDVVGGPSNRGAVYAAAVVIPIVVLSAIGFIIFCCLRKRKRRSQAVKATQTKDEEMKMENEHNKQPYIVPSCSLPQYSASSTTPVSPQPVILSGSNGAYLTGIDTSDVVSMTSGDNVRTDPLVDDNSLSDAPPPYRPRSLATPSTAPSSRQSSLRVTPPPPVSSQTRLTERSPFEDPGYDDPDDNDDDSVSELDEPIQGRNVDGMSAVSDVSYQEDPVMRRSPP